MPESNNPVYIGFYCSKDIKTEIEKNAKKENLSTSAFLRKRGTEITISLTDMIKIFENLLDKYTPSATIPKKSKRPPSNPSTTTTSEPEPISEFSLLKQALMTELKEVLRLRGKIE